MQTVKSNRRSQPLILSASALLAAAVILVLIFVTIARNSVWQDEEHLSDDTIRKSPLKPRAYYNAGVYFHDINDLGRAEEYYLKVTQLNKAYKDAYGSACYNLRLIYAKQ
jgi:hypothetical protein